MKILVIRFSSIGDIVLTTPVMRCIKQQLAGASVHFLTKASFKPVVAYNPYIDKVHYFDGDLAETIAELKKEGFDYVLDLHNNLRTARVKRALRAKSYSFPKLNIKKWLLVNLKVNLMPSKSIVERYMEPARKLGVKNDGQGLDYFLAHKDKLQNKDVPMSHWAGYVACVIGGSFNTKKLPVEKWKEFCKLVPYPVMLLGGPEDAEDGNAIAGQDRIKIYNACGKFSLNESAWLVQKAQVVVSNDTGLMHIAAAYKKPIISLWGNTSPEMGMYPYYGYNDLKETLDPKMILMYNENLSCHPCSKIGYDKCPKGHFKCMNELNMMNLAEFARKFWTIPQPILKS
jgi:ADP-heptose:LPS heptosyltransferase